MKIMNTSSVVHLQKTNLECESLNFTVKNKIVKLRLEALKLAAWK